MRYKLVAESFQVVSGDFKGRKYKRGESYEEQYIPPSEITRFERMIEEPIPAPAPSAAPAEPAKKKKEVTENVGA